MWWTIGFILLAIILSSKVGSDKSSAQQSDREFKAQAGEMHRFYEKYLTTAKEKHDIEIAIKTLSPEAEETIHELTDILGATPDYGMILWGMAAKIGKIPDHIWNRGSSRTPFESRNDPYEEGRTVVWLKYVKWYDTEIRKHGMIYPLMGIICQENKEENWRTFCFKDAKSIQVYNEEDIKRVEKGWNSDMLVYWEPIVRWCLPSCSRLR